MFNCINVERLQTARIKWALSARQVLNFTDQGNLSPITGVTLR